MTSPYKCRPIHFVLSVFLTGVVDAALDVNVPREIIAVKGGSAVFKISYTLSDGDSFNSIELLMGIQAVFTAPAIRRVEGLQNGSFSTDYESRGSTNYYHGKTQFTITLSEVTTDDEGEYTVKMTKNNQEAVPPVVVQLVLDVLPGTPSVSGAPTQPVSGGAGPTVLQCKANLGKPQASMVWSRRIGNAAYTNITENVNTTITNNTDGTSTLTVNLHTADNNVQFRCQVSNRQATRSAETGAIEVTDTTKLTENGEDGETVMPTETGEAVDTIKPTENGEGVGTIKPTAKPGVSAGHDDTPNKLVLGAAFVVMAMISTIT